MCPLRIPSTPFPRLLYRCKIIHSHISGAELWSSLITKVNFDQLALALESQTCTFHTKDNSHTCTLSYRIVVINEGSHSFFLPSFPLFLCSPDHQNLQPAGYLWMDLSQFSLLNWPKLINSLISVGEWEWGLPCPPWVSRSQLLWGSGKEGGLWLPCYSI